MRLVARQDVGAVSERARVPAPPPAELEELRKLVGAEQAFVFRRSSAHAARTLAASPADGAPGLCCADRVTTLERTGCLVTLEGRAARTGPLRADARPFEPTPEVERLVARVLGRLIVGSEGAVVRQVCESGRSLALAAPASLAVLREAEAVAPSPRPVLLVGESGVGKELVARLVHGVSGRPKLVAISMAQVRGDTAVSELFGHQKGAFTGALTRRAGAFVEAGDGTLFLDELADLQPEVAGLLLRAIEECRIRPLGSDQEVAVRARVVAATNQPEKLRPDLLHRFLHRIVIPPLRERKEDIRAIARLVAFRDGFELTEKAIRVLGFASAWKGNGRELESLLFHASQRAAGRIVGGEHVIAELAAAWGGPRWSGNGDDSWLRAVREGLGLSLRELSGVVGVPKSTLEDMERGQDRARACEILERLARGIEALDAERPVPKGERGVKVRDELKRFLAEE